MTIDDAGSIAEAALQVNGVFEAAQKACEQYIDNIKNLSKRQEVICDQKMKECEEQYHSVPSIVFFSVCFVPGQTPSNCVPFSSFAQA